MLVLSKPTTDGPGCNAGSAVGIVATNRQRLSDLLAAWVILRCRNLDNPAAVKYDPAKPNRGTFYPVLRYNIATTGSSTILLRRRRVDQYAFTLDGLYADFQKHSVNDEVMRQLLALAESSPLLARRDAHVDGAQSHHRK